MRPAGVRQRIRELLDGELDDLRSRPDRSFRIALASFINLASRLWYDDHPVTTVLRRYGATYAQLDDSSQMRTGTDFEAKCIACVEQLRPQIGDLAGRSVEGISLGEQDAAREPLLRVPPMTLLGEVNPDCYFHLICWNKANTLVEGMETPYRAARGIANMGFHKPVDPYGLIAPMSDLAERYEDYPGAREAVAQQIVDRLTAYLDEVPWRQG